MTRTELEMEFAGAALGWVERELEMTDPEIGQTLGVDRKTIYRWRKRESAPAPEQRRRMEKLTQLKWFLENSFRTATQGKRWLHQPVPALQGRTRNRSSSTAASMPCQRARDARVGGARLTEPTDRRRNVV